MGASGKLLLILTVGACNKSVLEQKWMKLLNLQIDESNKYAHFSLKGRDE